MRSIGTAVFLVLLMSLAAMASCSALDRRHPAVKVVEAMYAATSEGDMNAYMDAMLPENRRQPNPFGLLTALEFNIGPVGLDMEPGSFTFSDVTYSVLHSTDEYALVQAEGMARVTLLLWELPFCDQHDVRLVGERWYVDAYAPEREERLRQVMAERQESLQDGGLPGRDINDLFGGLTEVAKIVLNLCPAD